MWLIAISVIACAMIAATDSQLHCPHSGSQHTCSKSRNGRFFLDGHRISIQHDEDKFIMNCDDYRALDSEVLPFFADEYHLPVVKLGKCPLPEENSLVNVFRLININLIPTGNETTLVLNHLPSEPVLTMNHFSGLEHLTTLEVKAQTEIALSVDTFASLISLRTLKLSHIALFQGSGTESPVVVPDALEKLVLIDSRDKHLPVMGRCDSLRQFDLYKPNLVSLPERWIAACPNIEKITIKSADRLSFLPTNLLQGPKLKKLTISKCPRLKSLPEGFLAGVPNLLTLELTYNKLKTLSSEMFLGPKLNSLSLTANHLQLEDLKALASLTSLSKLELGQNRDLKNLCDENGYSPLRNLVQLRTLSFWEADITNICRDWRESMTFLENLDLRDTEPMALTFADLQFTRDPSVKNAKVQFEDVTDFIATYSTESPITSIVLTEQDYKNIASTPLLIKSPVEFIWTYSNMDCDCRMYWTRKAMDLPNFKPPINMDRIKCRREHYLKNMTPEDLCPGGKLN